MNDPIAIRRCETCGSLFWLGDSGAFCPLGHGRIVPVALLERKAWPHDRLTSIQARYPTVASFIVTWSKRSLCMRGVRQVLREGGIKNIRLRGWAWPAVESRLLMAKEKLRKRYFGPDRVEAMEVVEMIEADFFAGLSLAVKR